MQLLTTIGTPDEVSGAVVSGKSIIVFGTKASKAYARAIDVGQGKELWNLFLDQSAVHQLQLPPQLIQLVIFGLPEQHHLQLGLVTPTPTAKHP